MNNIFSLELYADDVMHQRQQEAAQAALIAQLPHAAAPRLDLAARLQLANGLRALAIRLDPCAAPATPTMVGASSR